MISFLIKGPPTLFQIILNTSILGFGVKITEVPGQTVSADAVKSNVGVGLTVILTELLVTQPPLPVAVYVMLCEPTPANNGLNTLLTIPAPLNVPPEGDPVKATADPFTHIDTGAPEIEELPILNTLMIIDVSETQPKEFVYL